MYWRKCVQWTGPKNPDNIFKNCSIPTKAFNVPANQTIYAGFTRSRYGLDTKTYIGVFRNPTIIHLFLLGKKYTIYNDVSNFSSSNFPPVKYVGQ